MQMAAFGAERTSRIDCAQGFRYSPFTHNSVLCQYASRMTFMMQAIAIKGAAEAVLQNGKTKNACNCEFHYFFTHPQPLSIGVREKSMPNFAYGNVAEALNANGTRKPEK
jgi:hypothetical protein